MQGRVALRHAVHSSIDLFVALLHALHVEYQ